jgi:hypothetical protein
MYGKNALIAITVAVGLSVVIAGCNHAPHDKGKAVASGGGHDHEGHDHAHHGLHHGHLIELGEEEYHAEWTHDESGKVTVYVLDGEAKKEVPIDADEIAIDVKVGNNAPVTYKLAAVNPMDGKSATFEIVDKQLLGALEVLKSPGVVATLKLTINGKPYEQRIEVHEHAH